MRPASTASAGSTVCWLARLARLARLRLSRSPGRRAFFVRCRFATGAGRAPRSGEVQGLARPRDLRDPSRTRRRVPGRLGLQVRGPVGVGRVFGLRARAPTGRLPGRDCRSAATGPDASGRGVTDAGAAAAAAPRVAVKSTCPDAPVAGERRRHAVDRRRRVIGGPGAGQPSRPRCLVRGGLTLIWSCVVTGWGVVGRHVDGIVARRLVDGLERAGNVARGCVGVKR